MFQRKIRIFFFFVFDHFTTERGLLIYRRNRSKGGIKEDNVLFSYKKKKKVWIQEIPPLSRESKQIIFLQRVNEKLSLLHRSYYDLP